MTLTFMRAISSLSKAGCDANGTKIIDSNCLTMTRWNPNSKGTQMTDDNLLTFV